MFIDSHYISSFNERRLISDYMIRKENIYYVTRINQQDLE